jgi:hypothetical protein
MKKGSPQICIFLVQLAGFILGGLAGFLPAWFVLWLALGAPKGPDSSAPMFAPMLLVGPAGFFIGGFVGMRLAGKRMKASWQHDAESGSGPESQTPSC